MKGPNFNHERNEHADTTAHRYSCDAEELESLREQLIVAEADRAKLIAMSRQVHALPFSPSNNGEQWDEGFKRGWDEALNQVFEIAYAVRREVGEDV